MNAQPIVGIDRDTGEIVPILKAPYTGLKCNCNCFNCGGRLEAVLNTTRKKYFRHYNRPDCNPMPETELHLLAKQIILTNDQIYVPFRGIVDYVAPMAEVKINEQVPDATVTIDGLPLYIEVVVTHGIDHIKFYRYKADNARVLVINLEEEDRELDYESLKEIVLGDSPNKEMLDYGDKRNLNMGGPSAESDNGLVWLIGIGAAVAFIRWKFFGKKKKKINHYRNRRR